MLSMFWDIWVDFIVNGVKGKVLIWYNFFLSVL